MRYRRSFTPGGYYFFTLTLQNRRQDLLVRHIDVLRRAFAEVKQKHPFDRDANFMTGNKGKQQVFGQVAESSIGAYAMSAGSAGANVPTPGSWGVSK